MSEKSSLTSARFDFIPDIPLFTAEVRDVDKQLSGWVVIHSCGASGACGGVRLYPDVNVEELSLLARAMTYKYSFFEQRTGGAKAGVQIPFTLSREERYRRLRSFGEHIAPLIRSRTYIPWTDMNSGPDDLRCIMEGVGLPPARMLDSAYYTALSTFAGILAVAQHLGMIPKESKITIEGFGNVGTHAAREIARWGGRLIGVSTRFGGVANLNGLDIDEIISVRRHYGNEWVLARGSWDTITCEELFSLPMNVHVPCARVHSVTKNVAEALGAQAVVPAANVPCNPEGEAVLVNKGVALLPDFVVNGGGIVGTRLSDVGCSDQEVRNIFFEDFKDMIVRLLRLSEKEKESVIHLAKVVAHEKYDYLRNDYLQRPGMKASSQGILRKVYRVLARPKVGKKRHEYARLQQIIRERFQHL